MRVTFLFWRLWWPCISLWLLVGYIWQHTFLSLWYALICSRPPIPLTDFLCKWIAYVNAACSGFIARAQQHTPVTYDKQEEKKCQFGYSVILRLQGKLYIWEAEPAFPFFLSSFSLLIQYIALCCIPSLLPPIAQFSLSLFVLTFFIL